MCASVESTFAGVDIDVVNSIIAAVEEQATFSDCQQLASCSLDYYDGHGESVILKMCSLSFLVSFLIGIMYQLFEKWQRCKWCG